MPTNQDRLRAMGQLGLSVYSLLRELRDADHSGRIKLAAIFGRPTHETEAFCDDIAEVSNGTTFRRAITEDIIESESAIGVESHLRDHKNGWVQERFSRSYWSNGHHTVEVSGFEFRLANDEGQFQEVEAIEMLRFLNSHARKAVTA